MKQGTLFIRSFHEVVSINSNDAYASIRLNSLKSKYPALVYPDCGWTKSCTTSETLEPCNYQQTMASLGFQVVQDFVHPQYLSRGKLFIGFSFPDFLWLK